MRIAMAEIQAVRQATGAGVLDCRRALEAVDGDERAAVERLRAEAAQAAASRVGRPAQAGVVDAYIHGGGMIGVLIHVACETDFLARSRPMHDLVRELELQIAAADPRFIGVDDVPAEVTDGIRRDAVSWARTAGKPEPLVERIAAGKVRRFHERRCLLQQPSIRDPHLTVAEVLNQFMAASAEAVRVVAFTRYEVPIPVGVAVAQR